MIEPTDEIQRAYAEAWYRAIGMDEPTVQQVVAAELSDPMPWRIAALKAVLALVERDLRAAIAYRIRAELVCCDIYEQSAVARAVDGPDVVVGEGPHSICYWGEAGARIAEGRPDDPS